LILPGEIANAHRHVAFAMRWGIEGDETYTSVAGQKMMLGAGDLILTPSWEWHYHGNDGSQPGIWLDSLDIPLASYAKVNFSDPYPTAKVPDK
jgi:gentisate 1,2-dioxygenase